jgi:hypothetical protein
MSIPSTIFLRPDPPTRPSHSDPRDRIPSDLALPRFLHERAVLELQLAEWCVRPAHTQHRSPVRCFPAELTSVCGCRGTQREPPADSARRPEAAQERAEHPIRAHRARRGFLRKDRNVRARPLIILANHSRPSVATSLRVALLVPFPQTRHRELHRLARS